jgi:hypothetical protein
MAKILIAAITVAVLDPAKKGELKYLPPGTTFTVKDEDEAARLVAWGAATYADDPVGTKLKAEAEARAAAQTAVDEAQKAFDAEPDAAKKEPLRAALEAAQAALAKLGA